LILVIENKHLATNRQRAHYFMNISLKKTHFLRFGSFFGKDFAILSFK
jgi:hypothetical protein